MRLCTRRTEHDTSVVISDPRARSVIMFRKEVIVWVVHAEANEKRSIRGGSAVRHPWNGVSHVIAGASRVCAPDGVCS